jgi:hypothetical protein
MTLKAGYNKISEPNEETDSTYNVNKEAMHSPETIGVVCLTRHRIVLVGGGYSQVGNDA